MTASVAALRSRRELSRPAPEELDRRVRRRVGIVWGLLVLDVLTYAPGVSILAIPSKVGQVITQGALPVALVLALTVNRRVLVRPNVSLCLVSLLVADALLTDTQGQHFGTLYRTFRLAEFIAVLWLLSPWWGRRDLLLVRSHLITMSAVLGSVLLGLLVSPKRAFINGRLCGIIWPIAQTQVAHYAAVTIGLVVVLWLCGRVSGRIALLVVAVGGAILLLTHTRTALIALVAGLLVAGLSLFAAEARVRKFFTAVAVAVSIGVMTFASAAATWLERGQNSQELGGLTGRTNVWALVVSFPRDKFQEIFGFGLSNDSFEGLAIDSNWLASYQAQGLFGVVVCGALLVFLFVNAYFQPRTVQRALALFLVTYCLAASFTEVGFTGASPYLLEVILAASLLAPPLEQRSGRRA